MKAKKADNESSPMKRRQSLNDDVEKFLAAGNKIEYIPDGVSAQDPQGRGKPLSSNTPQNTAPKKDDKSAAEGGEAPAADGKVAADGKTAAETKESNAK